MKLKLLSVIIAVAVINGCYDTKQDAKGRTIRTNRITGEMCAIEGDKIIKLKNENDVQSEREDSKQLGESRVWPAIPILKGYANATLKTKWGDGNIYYQLYVDKNLRDIANLNAELIIELYDSESFLIRNIPVKVSSMVVSIDSNGKPAHEMQYKEKIPINKDAYKKIKKWDVIWSGFNY